MNRGRSCGCNDEHQCSHSAHSSAELVQLGGNLRSTTAETQTESGDLRKGGQVFRVQGLDCHEEVALLERALGPLIGGVEWLQFDLIQGEMTIQKGSVEVSAERIVQEIATVGLSAQFLEQSADQTRGAELPVVKPRDTRLHLAVLSTTFCGLAWFVHLLLSGSFLETLHGLEGLSGVGRVVVEGLYLAGIVAGCWKSFPLAWQALRHFQADMHLLMTLAVWGGVLLQDWQEAGAVASLFAWSLLLESWTIGYARRSLRGLLDHSPTQVRRLGLEGEELIPGEAIQIGDRFRVYPGERIALDGVIVSGTSEVNQSPVTGETLPVHVGPGSKVYGGSLNGNQVLEILAESRWENSTMARIARLVRQAQTEKARSETAVERFARIYTPLMFCIAFGVWIGFATVGGLGIWHGLSPALMLLVISCPCALVISTPVSVVSALACAARQGVLIKGGRLLELPARIDTIAFDKTGTMTTGDFQVSRIVPVGPANETEVLQVAASLDQYSVHPVARSIVRESQQRGILPLTASSIQQHIGAGISGTINGVLAGVGSREWLQGRGIATPPPPDAPQDLIVGVGLGAEFQGWLLAKQRLRPELKEVLLDLRKLGVTRIVMLTGDRAEGAQEVAQEAGVTEIRSSLTPDQKLTEISQLEKESGLLAMIGDGINDAPALTRAPLGIALNSGGGETALEAADIALIGDDLRKIPWLIRHSRRMLGILKVNLVVALGVKLLFAGLAVTGHGSMWGAVVADMGTTLLVTANALRLLRSGDGREKNKSTTADPT